MDKTNGGHLMSAGGAVAAMRGRIIRAFANTGSFNEAEAKSLEELGLHFFARGMFMRMEQRGIIIRTKDNKFYMDRSYYDALIRRRRIVLPIVFIFVAVLVAFLIVYSR